MLTAEWSSRQGRWTVTAQHEAAAETRTYTCNYLISCTGYYNYGAGYLPMFPGVDRFEGRCVHPQFWPEDLAYTGKRVVVIGSGATAVTLIPAMADDVEHITMLQRSPSYIFTLPAMDRICQSAIRARPLVTPLTMVLARLTGSSYQRITASVVAKPCPWAAPATTRSNVTGLCG